jgi:hypothetical protein
MRDSAYDTFMHDVIESPGRPLNASFYAAVLQLYPYATTPGIHNNNAVASALLGDLTFVCGTRCPPSFVSSP